MLFQFMLQVFLLALRIQVGQVPHTAFLSRMLRERSTIVILLHSEIMNLRDSKLHLLISKIFLPIRFRPRRNKRIISVMNKFFTFYY